MDVTGPKEVTGADIRVDSDVEADRPIPSCTLLP